jgi:hypothetical protein
MPWLGRLVADLSLWSPGFHFSSTHGDLCGTKWHWDKLSSAYFRFALSVPSHQCSILIFIYTLLLPGRETGEVWEPFKKQCLFGNHEALDIKVLSLFLGLPHSLLPLINLRSVNSKQWVTQNPEGSVQCSVQPHT